MHLFSLLESIAFTFAYVSLGPGKRWSPNVCDFLPAEVNVLRQRFIPEIVDDDHGLIFLRFFFLISTSAFIPLPEPPAPTGEGLIDEQSKTRGVEFQDQPPLPAAH